MVAFHYTATDGNAQIIRGTLEADDERAVIGWLQTRGYFPLQVERPGVEEVQRPGLFPSLKGVRSDEVLSVTQQLTTLLEAGLDLDRSLGILVELTGNPRLRRILRDILRDIQGGVSFADSLAKHPKVFSRLYVNMVKAGEAGGVLELVLGRLATFMESAKAIRDEVLSALIYPSLVIAVGLGAVFVLLNFVIPRFARIFAEEGQLLPLPTRILLAVSALTAGYWWILLGLLVLGVLGVRGYIQTEEGKAMGDRLKLRLPIFGRFIRELEVARFARTFGTLLQSGVPVLTALSIVAETIGNVAIAQALPRLKEGVKRGEGIASPLKACGVFPPLAVHMAKVGEETGRLEEMLLKMADIYDGHVKTSLKRLLSLLEPLLILSLGLIVGFIVLSMLLAILSISDLPL